MLTSDGKKSIAVVWVLTVLSTVFLALRLVKKRKHIGIDDGLLCFAVVLLYLQAVGSTLCKPPKMRNLLDTSIEAELC